MTSAMSQPLFHLEPMTPADHAAVLALWNGCEGVRASETPEELARILARNPDLCPVARVGGVLAGAVLCGHDGRRGYLYHLGVAPEFRRLGIATALVEHCLGRLAAQGITRCTIFLIRGNAAGEAFWRKGGWFERTELVAFARDLSASQ
jgi:ribosomal protein S18 acetylase RimI-like enzyme